MIFSYFYLIVETIVNYIADFIIFRLFITKKSYIILHFDIKELNPPLGAELLLPELVDALI